jgi:hypothetical protein
MLENLSDQVRECLRLAEDSARKAASQRDPKLRQDFLDMEARWLLLARSFELSQRLNAFSQQAHGLFYSVHIRRKTGAWETELQIRQGKLPIPGDEIAAILQGQTLKARVLGITTNLCKAKGGPAVAVQAEEV